MTFIGWGEGPFSQVITEAPAAICPSCGGHAAEVAANSNSTKKTVFRCNGCKHEFDKPALKEDWKKDTNYSIEGDEYPKIVKARGDREDMTYKVLNAGEEEHLNQLLRTANERGGSERLQRLASAKGQYGINYSGARRK